MDKKILERIGQQLLEDAEEYLNNPSNKKTLEQVKQQVMDKKKEYLNNPLKKRIQIGISFFKTHWAVRKYYKRGWMFGTLKTVIKILLKKPFLRI